MSLINQFNQPDEASLHSSGMAGSAGAAKPQSFTERRQLDRQRQIIQGYRQSLQGMGVREPGAIKRPAPRSTPNADTSAEQSTIARRQAFNSGATQSTPPQKPTRYNPYA